MRTETKLEQAKFRLAMEEKRLIACEALILDPKAMEEKKTYKREMEQVIQKCKSNIEHLKFEIELFENDLKIGYIRGNGRNKFAKGE